MTFVIPTAALRGLIGQEWKLGDLLEATVLSQGPWCVCVGGGSLVIMFQMYSKGKYDRFLAIQGTMRREGLPLSWCGVLGAMN